MTLIRRPNLHSSAILEFIDDAKLMRLEEARSIGYRRINRPFWNNLFARMEELDTLMTRDRSAQVELDAAGGHPGLSVVDGCIEIGPTLDSEQSGQIRRALADAIQLLIPWRKGPFRICGHMIDAEWRSDLKWDRLKSVLEHVDNKAVLDVGCNNGYYLFRMSMHSPRLLVGCDPSDRCALSFSLLKRFLPLCEIDYEPVGLEHLACFEEIFDLTVCLGVIYHRRDPFSFLQQLKNTLKHGGTLLVESQVVPGGGLYAFCPPGRYAKAGNIYLVPTIDCLKGWLERAGFVDVETVSIAEVTLEEQRATAFAPYESLDDFLMDGCPSKTVEGHPAPLRAAVVGRKP